MWTRKELKEKSKKAFKFNYWKAVLVAFIMVLIVGTGSAFTFMGGPRTFSNHTGMSGHTGMTSYSEMTTHGGGFSEWKNYNHKTDGTNIDHAGVSGTGTNSDLTGSHSGFSGFSDFYFGNSNSTIFLAGFFVIFGIVFLIMFALMMAVRFLIMNPLAVGGNRFFVKNLNERGQIRELAFSFDTNYRNTVKVMFFKNLYTVLWSLLFVIPGIVKSYEYRMIPYLLAENADLSKEEAFARSKEMMMGNKWKTFVLDISFLPWFVLSAITFGIVGGLYVAPYVNQTNAALYDALKSGQSDDGDNVVTEEGTVDEV